MVEARLHELDWSPAARTASLSALFDHAVKLAVDAEHWYAAGRPTKRRAGRMLRIGTILCGAVAAVLPILSELTLGDGGAGIAPAWAAVALAAAGALVSLDHFFGFSSGWMRYMTSELEIRRLRHDFEYAWNATRASDTEGPKEVAALLALAHTFVRRIDAVVAAETASWMTEFRGGLEQTEHALSVNQPGGAPSPNG